MTIGCFNQNELIELIRETPSSELEEYMAIEDFEFLLNIDHLLHGNNETPTLIKEKYSDTLVKAEILKIRYLNNGVLNIDSFTNQELIQYTDSIIELPIFRDNKELEPAYKKLRSKIDRLKANAIVNTIDEYTKLLNMDDKAIKKLINMNNFNIYDILIELLSLAKSKEKYTIIEDLLSGKFFTVPLGQKERKIDFNDFTMDSLRDKLLIFDRKEGPYLTDNYYDTIYELREDVNPLLLDLEDDYQEGTYYKMKKNYINRLYS